MTDCEVKEYFSILQEACHVEESSLDVAYRQLRELLERLCRTQMPDGSLQMTDLSARISFVASKAGLSTVEQNRLHTFRALLPAAPCGCHLYSGAARQRADKAHARLFSVCR